MKDKPTLKVPFDFSYTELAAVEEYLEQSEQSGKHLKEIKKDKFVFEFTELERNYRYSAEIFKGDAFVKEFISDCENDGWELVGTIRDELHIFRTTDPYATDIMTDEHLNLKAIAKRQLLNPGFYGCGFYLIWRAIDLFFLRLEYQSLIIANYIDCMMWLFLCFYFTWLSVKFIDFFVWYIKSKKCIGNGEKIPFKSLREHEQDSKINHILLLAGTVVYFAASVFVGLGYVQDDWFQWLIGGFIVFEVLHLIYRKDKIKNKTGNKILRHIIALVCCVAVVFGVWSTVLYSEKKYEENYDNRLETVMNARQIQATAFAQHYWMKETVEANKSDDGETAVRYEVFVSDISGARGQYIKRLHKEFEKYDNRILKLKNHRWDEAYAEINEEGEVIGGYAFKDDKVIYVDYCYEVGIEKSLDIIYEKLFDEKK